MSKVVINLLKIVDIHQCQTKALSGAGFTFRGGFEKVSQNHPGCRGAGEARAGQSHGAALALLSRRLVARLASLRGSDRVISRLRRAARLRKQGRARHRGLPGLHREVETRQGGLRRARGVVEGDVVKHQQSRSIGQLGAARHRGQRRVGVLVAVDVAQRRAVEAAAREQLFRRVQDPVRR